VKEFLLFARGAGIDAIGDQLAHRVAPVARLLQSDVRVYAERNPLFFAGEAILETPPTAAGRRDLQIQAAAVEQADGFLLSGGILNFRGREPHGGNPEIRTVFLTSCLQSYPENVQLPPILGNR
jgi:hypothetical protein